MVRKSTESPKQASIIIPHYNTPEHLEFCLQCIEHFTDPSSCEIIVVDNGSPPETVEKLKKRENITLLERRQDPNLGQAGHKAALDLGISRASGRYIIAIHTDTFVIRKGWIHFLIDRMNSNGYLAVGPATHRLYPLSPWERLKKIFEKKTDMHWIRPVFTIYNPQIFTEHKFMDYVDVGELVESYVKEGRAGFISREETSDWAFHAGGTTKLHHLHHRRKATRKKERLHRFFLAKKEIQEIIEKGTTPPF
jgi:glycosyltransferase involved in cell wall biosynthesis